jgi:hypothetical protein
MAVEAVDPELLHMHGVRKLDRLNRASSLGRRGAAIRRESEGGGDECGKPGNRGPRTSRFHRECGQWQGEGRACDLVNDFTRPWPENLTRSRTLRKACNRRRQSRRNPRVRSVRASCTMCAASSAHPRMPSQPLLAHRARSLPRRSAVTLQRRPAEAPDSNAASARCEAATASRKRSATRQPTEGA